MLNENLIDVVKTQVGAVDDDFKSSLVRPYFVSMSVWPEGTEVPGFVNKVNDAPKRNKAYEEAAFALNGLSDNKLRCKQIRIEACLNDQQVHFAAILSKESALGENYYIAETDPITRMEKLMSLNASKAEIVRTIHTTKKVYCTPVDTELAEDP